MKKLLLLLFSLMLSFNSYAEWTEIISDREDKLYLDFENFQEKSDGAIYVWMMFSEPSKSEKIYLQIDCEFDRVKGLQWDTYTAAMGGGDVSYSEPKSKFMYPAPDTFEYRLIKVFCRIANETPNQRIKIIEKFVQVEQVEEALYASEKVDKVLNASEMIEEAFNTLEKPTVRQLEAQWVRSIAEKVKSNWRYQGAEDGWTCEVYVQQDENGNVEAVSIQNCNVGDSAKAKAFKNSIERAVYKLSPLPSAPDEAVFDREIVFTFGVN